MDMIISIYFFLGIRLCVQRCYVAHEDVALVQLLLFHESDEHFPRSNVYASGLGYERKK